MNDDLEDLSDATAGVTRRAGWRFVAVFLVALLVVLGLLALVVATARADAHRDSTSINGPGVIQPPALTPFAVNTARGIACPNVHGEALCVPGVEGKTALKAFAAWPTVETLRTTLKVTQDSEAAQRALTETERRARAARELEIVALRAALEAEKRRAGSLQKALDGSWWRTLLNYVVVPAGALGAGFALGRWAR